MNQKISVDPVTKHTLLTPSPTCMKKIGEPSCGHGVGIVKGDEHFVGEQKKNYFKGKPWSQLKTEAVYCPAEECYAPLATYLINECKSNNCSDDLTRYKVKLDSLNGIAGVLKNN